MRETGIASIEEFHYPASALPAPSIWREIPGIAPERSEIERTACSAETNTQTARQGEQNGSADSISEALQRSFEAGRAQGVEEGRQLERTEQGDRLRRIEKKRIESTAQLVEQFARDRDDSLRAAEPAIVKLALSIASRILVREAQMDPLFLTGAVRVALGQLAETASVRLRVPESHFALWSETIAHLPNLKVRPTVISDNRLHLGDCVVETDMGDAELGVESQLKEISRGFFDGLSSRIDEKPPMISSEKREELR